MNYPNYDTKVIERYQTKLVGWTYHEFKSPFDIHTIDDIRNLLEALQCGQCYWVRMTKNEVTRHRDDMSKRRAAGETIGKTRQPRSDIGVKRPRKTQPGTSKGAGDNGDDGRPPAKRQKVKAVPKPSTTVTKKARKSKKSQLPPTSNEYIDSDSDASVDTSTTR
jgi:hypothetical protein